MVENYSLSDIAAAAGEGGFGGNSLMVILVLFILIALGGGGFGVRNDYGQYATAASQQEILFGQQFQNLDNKMDRLGNGISDATFALNNTVTTEGRNIQSMIAQHGLDLANYNAGIQQAIHAEGEATRNMMQQNKIESLQGQINQLQLQNAMCGVVRYPNQWTYNAGASPFCGGGNCCGNI